VVINLVTMLLPIGCLAFSRNVLGLDDPFSDNISANVIGLFLGLVSRFYLFRIIIFRSPPALPLPLLHEHGHREPGTDLSDAPAPTATSTCGPARPPAP
jgi:hypothetical protein